MKYRPALDKQAPYSSMNVSSTIGGSKFLGVPTPDLPVGRALSSNIVGATAATPLNESVNNVQNENQSQGRTTAVKRAFETELCLNNL